MSVDIGKSITYDGLIYHFDAGNPTNYTLSEVEVLVVAGGGAGGNCKDNSGTPGAGGGGGGVLYSSSHPITPGTPITVTVGNGGSLNSTPGVRGSNGQNSVFGYLTAVGGGGGGGDDINSSFGSDTTTRRRGDNGGSGGGSGNQTVSRTSGTPGQGFGGGGSVDGAGGGGGAGEWGYDSPWMGFSGRGGNGLMYNISGRPTYYGGGGGGGGYSAMNAGYGGLGGGGNGANRIASTSSPAENGQANTGGGGGGGAANQGFASDGGAGGSGVVIVRYPGPQKATGGTITQVGGYTIHTFNSSGTFTPLSLPTNGGLVYGLQDLSKNQIVATSSGGPTYNNLNSGSVVFDGVNDILVTQSVNLSGNQLASVSQTFSVWAMVTGGPNSPAGLITQHNYTSPANFGINHVGGNKLAPSIGYINGSREYADKITNFTITNNVIFNAVLVYNSPENKIYWYINGQLDSSYTLPSTPKSSNHPICIGRWDAVYGDYHFIGRIYNASVYNKALSSSEVLRNFNALRGRYGI